MFSRILIRMFLLIACVPGGAIHVRAQALEAIAVLDAHSFIAGPTSGQWIGPANGIEPPFPDRQPLQGISGLLHDRMGGSWLAVGDNGFGSKANSADHLLRVMKLVPEFKTAAGGSGLMQAESLFVLSDPDHHLAFPLIADLEHYPGTDLAVPVELRQGRWLTGADIDTESFQQMADGSFWFGDEFGPFLLHSDAQGRVLGPPVALPGVYAPQNPLRGSAVANARSSGGFEGMAISGDGKTLYLMLEKSLLGEPEGQLNVYAFDTAAGRFSPEAPLWCLQLADPAHRIGDLLALEDGRFLVLERDSLEGEEAAYKRVVLADPDVPEACAARTELVDLLAIKDPRHLSSQSGVFRFPFSTIEGIALIDAQHIAVINDNNYPFSVGRRPGQPANTELILIRLAAPLY